MADQICELIEQDGQWVQVTRDASPEEQAEIDARKSAPPTIQQYEDAVQATLDAAAQSKGYDNIISACSYAGAPNAFQAEAQAFIAWRGAVWASCYQTMAAVQAGSQQAPSIADLLASLPTAPQ